MPCSITATEKEEFMLRKTVIVFAMIFLAVGVVNRESTASKHKHHKTKTQMKSSSDADFYLEVSLEKDIDPDGEEQYSIGFEMGSEDESGLEGITQIQIKSPKGKKIHLKNGLRLAEFDFGSEDMSFKNFQNMYPEGKYMVTLYPKSKYGSRTFDISYNFPLTPEITYPENGAVDLPLSFTVEWESLDDDIDGLYLDIHDGDEFLEFNIHLSSDTTFFVIPDGMLKPDTQYDMQLTAYKYSGAGLVFSTIQSIVFTTGSE